MSVDIRLHPSLVAGSAKGIKTANSMLEAAIHGWFVSKDTILTSPQCKTCQSLKESLTYNRPAQCKTRFLACQTKSMSS